jgi:hypothetical protein
MAPFCYILWMFNRVCNYFRSHEVILVCLLVLVFILVRFPGRNLPLHQDEYKWPGVEDLSLAGHIPHPPVGELIYHYGGLLVGFDVHFRLIPFFFGALNLLLLYYLMRFMFGRREATIASLIWIFSYFSVLASLMVDTDGAVMPFFFLVALIGYYKLPTAVDKNKKIFWWVVFLLGLFGGILVKMSFILAVGAIIADFLWSKRYLLTKKELLKYAGYALVAILGFGVLLFISKYLFTFFDLGKSVGYWEHFFTLNRGWFQTFIQCMKAVLYSSPFLVLIPFFATKNTFAKVRVFIFFLIFSFIFYVLLFDFSIGALDRYLQLLVLPLTVFSTLTIVEVMRGNNRRTKEFLFLGIIVALVFVVLQSIPQYVPPLHPKAEWVSRILSFKWNFVYPFSGGSGPLGFYVSFLFMALCWISSFVGLIIALVKPEAKKLALMFILPLGITYNGVFIEEYMFGFWNGHAATLVYHAADFIRLHPEIKKVTVYNDNGAQEVKATGTYRRRLYTDPAFIGKEKVDYLNTYKEFYFVLDVPRVDPTSMYQRYFDSCKPMYTEVDKKMSATVYDCRGVPDISL